MTHSTPPQNSATPEAREIGMLELFWLSCKNHMFAGTRRATRREYWNFLLLLLPLPPLILVQAEAASDIFGAIFGMALIGMYAIHPFVLTGIAQARLYDIGGKAWQFYLMIVGTGLLTLAACLILGSGSPSEHSQDPSLILAQWFPFFIFWPLLNLLLCVVIGCIPSSPKPNGYEDAIQLPPTRPSSSYPAEVYPRCSHLHERLLYGLRHALSRRGRADREEFWPYFFVMAVLVLLGTHGLFWGLEQAGYYLPLLGKGSFTVLYLLLGGICVRRFRDAGLPAWIAELIWVVYVLFSWWPSLLINLPSLIGLAVLLSPLVCFVICLLPSRLHEPATDDASHE